MKFTVTHDVLMETLSKMQSVVEKKTSMPALTHVHFETVGEMVRISATDLDISIQDLFQADVDKEGKMLIPAKDIFDLMRDLDSGENLIFELGDNRNVRVTYSSGICNFSGLSPDDFPALPDYSNKEFYEIDSNFLHDMIQKTSFSMSMDETRYHLNGVYLETSEDSLTVRAVSTDGHRLSLVEREVPEKGKLPQNGIIIPRKGTQEIRKLCEVSEGDLKICFEKNMIYLTSGDTVLFVRLIDGKYPNYRMVIPESTNRDVTISRDTLIYALKRVSLFANQKSRAVRFDMKNGSLKLSASTPEKGDVSEELPIDLQGDDIAIGFNARYVLDVLSSMDSDDVILKLSDTIKPGLFMQSGDDNYLCVVMPTRL